MFNNLNSRLFFKLDSNKTSDLFPNSIVVQYSSIFSSLKSIIGSMMWYFRSSDLSAIFNFFIIEILSSISYIHKPFESPDSHVR